MPLVNGNILLDRIREKRVLAGAFNTTNLETTISILDAIERSGLPNFIQIARQMQNCRVMIISMKLCVNARRPWMCRSVSILTMVKSWLMLSGPFEQASPP